MQLAIIMQFYVPPFYLPPFSNKFIRYTRMFNSLSAQYHVLYKNNDWKPGKGINPADSKQIG